MVLELKHYVAAARLAFHRLECAAAHQKFRAVFAKHLREGDAEGLVPFRLNDIDTPNPISLRHVVVLIFAFSPSVADAPADVSYGQKRTPSRRRQPLRTVSALTRTIADASCMSTISIMNAPSLLGRRGGRLNTAHCAI